jgi:nitrate reductase gamma subunit
MIDLSKVGYDAVNLFFWVVFPYIAITIFFIGNAYRFFAHQYTWTSKSSEILEKKTLRPASMLFHYGVIFAFIGHIIGIVIPKSWTQELGITEELYEALALYAGTAAGLMMIIGLVLFIYRRLSNPRLKAITSTMDWIVLILLLAITILGNINTIVLHHDYRETVAPWFRGLWMFTPNYTLMAEVPFILKLHIFLVFVLTAIFPFTRLVHMLSIPLSYIFRKPIIYRERCPQKI